MAAASSGLEKEGDPIQSPKAMVRIHLPGDGEREATEDFRERLGSTGLSSRALPEFGYLTAHVHEVLPPKFVANPATIATRLETK